MATDIPTSPCAAISFATKPSTTDPRPDGAGVGGGGHDCTGGVLLPPQATRPHATKKRVAAARAFRPTVSNKTRKGNASLYRCDMGVINDLALSVPDAQIPKQVAISKESWEIQVARLAGQVVTSTYALGEKA